MIILVESSQFIHNEVSSFNSSTAKKSADSYQQTFSLYNQFY